MSRTMNERAAEQAEKISAGETVNVPGGLDYDDLQLLMYALRDRGFAREEIEVRPNRSATDWYSVRKI